MDTSEEVSVIIPVYNDEKYLKKKYKAVMHKELNLDNPKTFNEKLQWLKINDHNPEYTMMVDKYEVKKYIENIIGEEHIVPTIGILWIWIWFLNLTVN